MHYLRTDGQTDGATGGLMDELTDRPMVGWTDGMTNGRPFNDVRTHLKKESSPHHLISWEGEPVMRTWRMYDFIN